MRRQLNTGIHDAIQAIASGQHRSTYHQLQGQPLVSQMEGLKADLRTGAPLFKKEMNPEQYPLSERMLRASAFSERVQHLKYYIGLIGAKSNN